MAIKQLIYVITLIPIISLFSCTDDIDNSGIEDTEELVTVETSIEFNFSLPANSRALTGAKTTFVQGDIIHISARFSLDNNNVQSEEIRYGALVYNNNTRKWEPVQGSKLTWPTTAVRGVFTAYHIPTFAGSDNETGGLITNNEPNISLLENVTKTTDPLFAETQSPVNYGGAVNLRFSHLCTYLKLQELRPVYNQFIFSTEEVKDSISAQGSHGFCNAFSITLNEDNTLSFSFCQSPHDQDTYYITSNSEKNADNSGACSVGFFLQPGYYDKFRIYYPTGDSKTPFLKFKYTPIQGTEEEPNTPPMLEAGTAYILDTTIAPGITIESPSQEDDKPWPEDSIVSINVNDFLTAITRQSEYRQNGKVILEKNSTGLRLTCNVDFKDTIYTWLNNGTLPNVPQGETLDGDNHTIYHLGSPLFNRNEGRIVNLGLNGLNAEVILNQHVTDNEHNGGPFDFSRQGGLCRWNSGEINNVRLTDFTISASVIVENDSDNEDFQDTENIGLIAGSNTGTIDKVRLSGNFSVTVETNKSDTNGSNCTINLGGLVGQNTDAGTINDISSLDGGLKSLKVVNKCCSEVGAYYVGGLVGYNAGYVGAIGIPNIDVDCSGSQGTKLFTGILVGEITTSTQKTATITSSNVVGSAKAGRINVYKDLDSGSYVGGIAGASVPVEGGGTITVSDCMIVAKLLDNSEATDENCYNGTGGCFGRIYANFNINNISLTLQGINALTGGDDRATGSFAGFVSDGFNWDWSTPNSLYTSLTLDSIGGRL